MDFDKRDIRPMLIGVEQPAFDDEDYIYEWKMDGVRCLVYVDEHKAVLQNKRGLLLNRKFPELKDIGKQVKHRCILDGELYIFKDGINDFFEVQKRTLTSDPFKIRLHASKYPATFTAFDILYDKDQFLVDLPLMKRKQHLSKIIKENERINISRYIEKDGIRLFDLAKQHGLEGIVAKRKESKYHIDKRTKEWIKCKNLLDDDFVITGYILKEKGVVSLVMAQYDHQHLTYMGHVSMGVSLSYLQTHSKKSEDCPFDIYPEGNENAIWIKPFLVGTVKFMEYTKQGGRRQPVFKGFRDDKLPEECMKKAQ